MLSASEPDNFFSGRRAVANEAQYTGVLAPKTTTTRRTNHHLFRLIRRLSVRILRAMIVESSRPLASVEQDFAADSSGFTTCRFESWYDHKYGVIRRQHEWVKVHIMVGVKTNVVTVVEIKDKDAQDAPQLPAMLATTAENFIVLPTLNCFSILRSSWFSRSSRTSPRGTRSIVMEACVRFGTTAFVTV